MAKHSQLESKLSTLLDSSPKIKSVAKRFYLQVRYLLSRNSYKCEHKHPIQIVDGGKQTSFFGYYDKSPVNRSGLTLAHLSDVCSRNSPNPDKPVQIAVFDSNGIDFTVVEDTYAYNWQQGARTHWLSDDLFAFNSYDEGSNSYICKVYSSSKTVQMAEYKMPVQDSYYPRYFLSLNYSRLARLSPDYGYYNKQPLDDFKLLDLDGDGIWMVDFKSGNSELLVSLSSICAKNFRKEFVKAKHSVNHILISPSGGKIVFIHRYYLSGKRCDRLILVSLVNNYIKVVVDSGMVSHYCWLDDSNLFAYMRHPEGDVGFYTVNIDTEVISRFLEGIHDVNGDGHPTTVNNRIVLDTYPDKARMQTLSLIDIGSQRADIIGRFYHSFEYWGESRCDLHPRFSPDGKRVYFDTVYSGKRKLCFMSLE